MWIYSYGVVQELLPKTGRGLNSTQAVKDNGMDLFERLSTKDKKVKVKKKQKSKRKSAILDIPRVGTAPSPQINSCPQYFHFQYPAQTIYSQECIRRTQRRKANRRRPPTKAKLPHRSAVLYRLPKLTVPFGWHPTAALVPVRLYVSGMV